MSVQDIQAGTTKHLTWINSGVTPSAISVAVITGSETIVSSVTMTSSGDGHYFSNVTFPNSSAFFTTEFNAIISSKPYITKKKIRTVLGEVD